MSACVLYSSSVTLRAAQLLTKHSKKCNADFFFLDNPPVGECLCSPLICIFFFCLRHAFLAPGHSTFTHCEQNLFSTLQSGHLPSHCLIDNTVLAPSGVRRYCSSWILGFQLGGRGRTVYKWHLALIKSSACWSTRSAEGLASTVMQAGPMILR